MESQFKFDRSDSVLVELPPDDREFITKTPAVEDLPEYLGHVAEEYRPCVWGPMLRYNAYLHHMEVEAFLNYLLSAPSYFQVLEGKMKDASWSARPSFFLPGHLHSGDFGPSKADVMVIGKMPSVAEMEGRRNFIGPSGNKWKAACRDRKLVFDNWYITNICKTIISGKTISKPLFREFLPVLMYEIFVVQPKVIVCMGADALKALWGPRATLSSLRGAVVPYEWADHKVKAKTVAIIHPAQVLRSAKESDQFERDMDLVAKVIAKPDVTTTAPTDYKVIETFDDLDQVISSLIDEGITTFSLDCEWSGNHPSLGVDHYLRSIQLSWKTHQAIYLKCVDSEGRLFLLARGNYVLGEHLKPLFNQKGLRLIGHNIRSDIPWIEDLGIDEKVLEDAVVAGWDTMLASHVINEDAHHALNDIAVNQTDLGRYDLDLNRWCKINKIEVAISGYRRVPDDILIPYALRDADATFRLYLQQSKVLEELHEQSLKHEPRVEKFDGSVCTPLTLFKEIELRAQPAILEIERNGILVDVDRLDYLTSLYVEARDALLDKLRTLLCWSEFNPRSIDQARELLFSTVEYKNKKPLRAPAGARHLDCKPIKDTASGHGTSWAIIEENGDCLKHAPSTDAATLKELATTYDYSELTLYYHWRCLDTICKNLLRPPIVDPQTGQELYDEKGLRPHIRPDGRIHTSLSQLTETGRYRSSRPNLQNVPTGQQKMLTSILKSCGYLNIPPIRTVFRASPGAVFVESDYVAAELVTMAHYSHDSILIDILSDPRRDLHLETANGMFGLGIDFSSLSIEDLEEEKEKYKPDRTKAKAINFGIPYGLGADGLLMDLRAQGMRETTKDDVIDYLEKHKKLYKELHLWLKSVADNVRTGPGYYQTVWGRRRHFYSDVDDDIIARQERQAKNFPIQSVVADCLTQALVNFWEYKRVNNEDRFRIIIPVHDSIMFEVKTPFLREFFTDILERCMCIPIPGLDFVLRISKNVCLRWGEKPSVEELLEAGVFPADIDDFVSTRDT